jgi:hypothetical protein
MDNLLRTASLQLHTFDNKEVVKIAGVLSKLKSYLRQLGDREYAEAVDVLRSDSWMVQQVATELRKKIKELTKAIDEGDIPSYDMALEEVRSLTTDLATELKKLNQDAQAQDPRLQETVSSKPEQIIEPTQEGPEKYTREEWDDPAKRAGIFSYVSSAIKMWHPEHDVPVGKNINKPLRDFKWFDDKEIHIKRGGESGARDRLIEQTAMLLRRETSVSYEEARKTLEDSSVFDELAKRLVNAIHNGVLLHYIPATPMREPKDKNKPWIKERQIGEMEVVVKTADFLIPVYNVLTSMVTGLIDMGTPLNGVNKLVLTYTQYGRVLAGGVPPALRKEQKISEEIPMDLSPMETVEPEIKTTELLEKPIQELSKEPPKKRVRKKKNALRLELLQGLIKRGGIDFSAVQRLPDSFWIKFVAMCDRLGARPEDLAKVINSESGFDPHATNVQDGRIIAKGLNQLTKKTALALGMSESEWKNYENFPAEEQLKYVEKFFKSVGNMTGVGGKWSSPTQLYVANFAPKYVRKASDPNTVLYSAKTHPEEYDKNKGLDKDQKGYITAGDLARSVQNRPLSDFVAQAINKAKGGINLKDVSFESKPENDNADKLLNVLFALDVGPVEKIVRHSLERKYLPSSDVLITLSSLSASYPIRMKFAKSVSAVLKEIIDADVSIHTNGAKIELYCLAAGSQYSVSSAIQGLCDCVSKAAEIKFGKRIKCMILPSTLSKYAEVKL